ncbi:MAG: AI-2E family transporter [Candidatus Woesearchaeota archaeon]
MVLGERVKEKLSSNFFIIVLLSVLFLAALVVGPYMGYIVLAMVIAYAARPLYLWFVRRLKVPKGWSAGIMVVLTILFLFLPSIFIMRSLVVQASNTLAGFDSGTLERFSGVIGDRFSLNLDAGSALELVSSRIQNFLITESFNVIGSIADIVIGVLITFFVLFYLFRDGDKIYRSIGETLPLKKEHKQVLFGEMQLVTNAVIYGQLIIALIQGVAGGLAWAIFGLNNAVFWGFVIAIISFLPLVGTLTIFIPAGLLQIVQHGNYFSGIGIMVFGVILVMNVDSIVRPLIISERSRLNAALILIGVIGGVKAFGFMGFIIGPLVLALLIALLQAFRKNFRPSEELEWARKGKSDHLIIPLHERPPDKHRQGREWSESVRSGKKSKRVS